MLILFFLVLLLTFSHTQGFECFSFNLTIFRFSRSIQRILCYNCSNDWWAYFWPREWRISQMVFQLWWGLDDFLFSSDYSRPGWLSPSLWWDWIESTFFLWVHRSFLSEVPTFCSRVRFQRNVSQRRRNLFGFEKFDIVCDQPFFRGHPQNWSKVCLSFFFGSCFSWATDSISFTRVDMKIIAISKHSGKELWNVTFSEILFSDQCSTKQLVFLFSSLLYSDC